MRDLLPVSLLSRRELEVITVASQGHCHKTMARHLGITPLTVKAHIRTILRKLEVRNITHAVATCLRHGVIQ